MNEKKIIYYSRTRWDTMHLYKYNTETGQFFWMDHCWTGEGQWVLRSEPYPNIVEISEERAMEISMGTLYTAPEFEK